MAVVAMKQSRGKAVTVLQ